MSGVKSEREVISEVMPGVVQIVALKKAFRGNYQSAWTGSGTLVHPQGVVLTNCHVANPRAMGMPSPDADILGVSITERSDKPPVLTYRAEIVVQAPERDLAVLRITGRLDGKKMGKLDLPYIPVGDSDHLELGDIVKIFGYPGIGGETITFTSGSVAGFTQQKDITPGRAWIKTDATIAGGNSGGTAVDFDGHLVGIPTQAAAGTGISPVDARPVVDTNRDGRIDQRDTPMAIGGFINGLRPVNLAVPLLEKAGMQVNQVDHSHDDDDGHDHEAAAPKTRSTRKRSSSRAKKGRMSGGLKSLKSSKPADLAEAEPRKKESGPEFSHLVFSDEVTRDGRPINPSAILPGNRKQLFATFNFSGMRKGTKWSQTWAVNGKVVMEDDGKWEEGSSGTKTIAVASRKTLPDGKYHLVLTIRDQVAVEGEVTVGRTSEDVDTEISGQIIDRDNKRGVKGALVIALKPGVRGSEFVKKQSKEMAFTSARSDRNGRFTFKQQLPKGQSYGLVVIARGYRDMVVESGLRIGANSPEQAQIMPVPMIRD